MRDSRSFTNRTQRRRRLGQHLLLSEAVAQKMVDASGAGREDTVFEVGAGRGILTKKLACVAKSVVSFEIDEEMYLAAKDSLVNLKNVTLRLGDAFSLESKEINFELIVSSLPYSRSLDFIEWAAERASTFRCAVVLVQKEFAGKLLAKPGSKNYRAISVICQSCFSVERLENVGPQEFDPAPKVISCICKLTRRGPSLSSNEIVLIKKIFSFRGKLLRSALKKMKLNVDRASLTEGIIKTRVEKLEPSTFLKLVSFAKQG